MTEAKQIWLTKAKVSWVRLLCFFFGITACVLAAFYSPAGEYLESRIARRFDFFCRDKLGKSSVFSPRLKIYSIDDSTMAMFGGWVLPLERWAVLLKAFAANHPRAIVIDAAFGKGDEIVNDAVSAKSTLAGLEAPVIIGAFLTPSRIRFREQLRIDRPEYRLSAMRREGATADFDEALIAKIPDRASWFAYGPPLSLQPYFPFVGHIHSDEGGSVEALLKVGDDAAIGHVSLYVAHQREIQGGKLVVDGVTVPIDRRGRTLIDYPPLTQFYDASLSLRGALLRAEAGQRSELVKEDDVVLILPQMYTGNTDWKDSPFGRSPGGYAIAAMINSVLTGSFLKPVQGTEFLIAVLAAWGILLGLRLSSTAFWLSTLGCLGFLFALCQYLFAFHSVVVPWLFPFTAFLSAATMTFAEKTRLGERKVQALRQALEGALPKEDLEVLLKRPERISFEARERVVTLMFIDVVGFSLFAENMLPRLAFDQLKNLLETIGHAVHAFGGIIDKTLGDGLLCYFGYSFDHDSSSPDHAEKALACALRIQRDSLSRNLDAAESGDPIYPLRIGINTASCYLGDLGSGERVDFTVVGNGVNFAKRLEGAAESHSVLVGSTTHDLVKSLGLPTDSVTKRFIRIKHHSELVEAYEYDPFYAEPDLKQKALEAFRKASNMQRADRRWAIPGHIKIKAATDFGPGELVNFSGSGLSLKLERLLAKGTTITLTLDDDKGALATVLAKDGLAPLAGEVRFGYGDGLGFVHGVALTKLNTAGSEALVKHLFAFAFAHENKAVDHIDNKDEAA